MSEPDDVWFAETDHKADYSCCATVRVVVTLTCLDGREVNTSTHRELHDVYMGEQTLNEVVSRAIREGRYHARE